MKKINLGCGNKYIDGFINVDVSTLVKTDIQLDLEQANWPFEDNSIEHIVAHHVLEDLSKSGHKNAWKEMYRICKHDAVVELAFPYHFSTAFFSDPTHQTAVTLDGLILLNKKANDHFIQNGYSNSTLAYDWDVDFYLVAQDFVPSPISLSKFGNQPDILAEYGKFNVDIWDSVKAALKCRKEDKKVKKDKKDKKSKKEKA